MASNTSEIKAVATNIITGFLGVGKTSAILHLLKSKPAEERWAVLVNEFGEIGVDASMIEGRYSQSQGVFIKEVPGGCMCCAAGLPMQIALNQLLSRARPDRLLIEPTGLGHPKEVLQVLSANYNRETLSLEKTVTLVDARNLVDKRYTQHDTFNQQIAVADIVIGNKLDLYQADEQATLQAYVQVHGQPHTQVVFCQNAAIPLSLLAGPTLTKWSKSSHQHTQSVSQPMASQVAIPDSGFIKAVNSGEGFNSIGWRFSASRVFSYSQLFECLTGVSAQRMKAVFITDNGVFGYNLTADVLTELALDDCLESRIEIIDVCVDEGLEEKLLACIEDQTLA